MFLNVVLVAGKKYLVITPTGRLIGEAPDLKGVDKVIKRFLRKKN